MNTLNQILTKRIQRRDSQIKYLLGVLEEASSEVETLSSLACAFALDLAAQFPEQAAEMEKRWNEAISAALAEESK